MKIIVTGAAGFIGHALSSRLCAEGHEVIGVDNLNDYYSVELKKRRLDTLRSIKNFKFHLIDISEKDALFEVFQAYQPDVVVNLAAQAGVRYSIINPDSYTRSNLVGFANILEACRHFKIKHLVFASSSSVYGRNKKVPFNEDDRVDFPVSYYAATKKSGEVMAASYAKLYGLPCTGLRFFTVIGPWGRPDMAAWLFTDAILQNKPIKVFNYGNCERDFTYIDDIVEGIYRIISHVPTGETPFNLFNIGNNTPTRLEKFISILEDELGKKAEKIYLPMQDGDVPATYADIHRLQKAVGFKPVTSIETSLHNFVAWYKNYHGIA